MIKIVIVNQVLQVKLIDYIVYKKRNVYDDKITAMKVDVFIVKEKKIITKIVEVIL